MSDIASNLFQTQDFESAVSPSMTSWLLIVYNSNGNMINLPHVFDDRLDIYSLYRAGLWGENWSEEDLVWHKEFGWYYWATDRLDNRYELRRIDANTMWSRDHRHGEKG